MKEGGYKTVKAEVAGTIFKEKGSKFIGFAIPISTRNNVAEHLEKVRAEQPGASHYCYAWRMGTQRIEERTYDDGEPRQTAGAPILGQITSFEITNILLVVIRYYGGKKLGTGGLINAYRTAARSALENSVIVHKEFECIFALHFSYELLHKILHHIKSHRGKIKEKEIDQQCRIVISLGDSKIASFSKNINQIKGVELEQL